jgi:hypothetical protein
MEDGLSIPDTWIQVNSHHTKSGQPSVTRSAVYTLSLALKPKLSKITEMSQGSKDPNSAWSKARYNWFTHLLIRFGELDSEQNLPPMNGLLPPPWLDKEKLTPLTITQVVWWDETHWRCTAGKDDFNNDNRDGYIIQFPRAKNGKLDLENGSYDEKEMSRLKVKSPGGQW